MNRFNPSDPLEPLPIAVATQKPGGHPNPSAMISQRHKAPSQPPSAARGEESSSINSPAPHTVSSKQRKGPSDTSRPPFRPFGTEVFRRFTPWRPPRRLANQRPSSADGIRRAAGVWVSVTHCSRPVAGWEPTTITTRCAGDLPVGFWKAGSERGARDAFGGVESWSQCGCFP